ncbi:uncharacterized protein LOC128545987 [Mercenaria mercenaria]|uniref:uncharacterized protein LOC128545987 n=1 Tax=Mercenaria mercenaria TaxID=6596 RepID=UPI00234F6EEE|nr:uncharacterized protein LOC128545987 [Mercenaria mercenaria]
METKQYMCLAKVEKVQSEVLAMMEMCSIERVPERSRHNSAHHGSLPDLCSVSDKEMPKSEFLETKTDDNSDIIYKRASGDILEEETFVGLESTSPVFPELEKNPTGNTPMVPTDDTQAPQKSKRRPTFVPPVEETVEEMAQKRLIELSDILKVDSRGKMIKSGEMYEKFQEKCKQIKRQLPGLTAELLLQEQHSTNPLVLEYYQNTPEGFQAYKSSGKDNSCLYQSVALLLVGSEKLQFSLRLLATLHAVESFRLYKKQLLEMHLENLKLFFSRHINDSTLEEISSMDDVESVTDMCLQILIMETACLGIDSSVLHVGFLSGALGMNIHQHFQQYSEYGNVLETVPWEKIIQDLQVNSDLPDLHIFWVNDNKIENGIMNYIVPLKQKDISSS